MPEGAHPLDTLPRGKGWAGIPRAELDGTSWTVDFAAKMLDLPERDLRDLIRIAGLAPSGTLNMRGYRTQGRTPRAYPAEALIRLAEAAEDLKFPDSPDSD